jgi:glycosyltransferase involved in cell wall biosynthesis
MMYVPAMVAVTRVLCGPKPGIVWVGQNDGPPHRYLVAACRQAGEMVRELHWGQPQAGERPLGREIEFGHRRAGRQQPMSVRVISPRLLVKLASAPEDVIVIYELGLVGLYAGLAKVLRRRKVVSLIEGDYRHLGRRGTAAVKVAVRRLAARFVDAFVANNEPAKNYLVGMLKVPEQKIIVGWWLAGLPSALKAHVPRHAGTHAGGGPYFVYAGQLIPRKGVDLLIGAVATYQREFGPCTLWIIGEGPERASLVQLARQLDVGDAVVFLGSVDHEALKGALEVCQVFVFPTLADFVGRVVVEALTAGVPVVVSPMTGAVGTIVQDGVNGIVVDPRDPRALAEAMHRAADPATLQLLRAGVRGTNESLTPDAGAEVILRAVALARGRVRSRRGLDMIARRHPEVPTHTDETVSLGPRPQPPRRRARRGAKVTRDPYDP